MHERVDDSERRARGELLSSWAPSGTQKIIERNLRRYWRSCRSREVVELRE